MNDECSATNFLFVSTLGLTQQVNHAELGIVCCVVHYQRKLQLQWFVAVEGIPSDVSLVYKT